MDPGQPTQLERELNRLLIGTNDQRRRVGQTLYHFYRTLVFWMSKGLSFYEITKAWSAGGAAVFDSMATTLAELGDAQPDRRLRTFTCRLFEQLAGDLERGDHMLVPFLRWLEGLFPELTEMIRQENTESRIYDLVFARELAASLAMAAGSTREGMIEQFRLATNALEA